MSVPAITAHPVESKLLFSRKESAQLTGLSVPFIDILIRDGRLRVKRVGARVLVPRSELLRFAEIEGSAVSR